MEILELPNFSSAAKVTVIGDVMLDSYWYGTSTRISPEAPVPVVNVDKFEHRAGGAANVAINLSSLGVPCNLIGLVGEDSEAERLTSILEEKHVSPMFVTVKGNPTITKLRVLSRHQQLIRVDFEKGYENVDKESMIASLKDALKDTKVLICSDYGKGALSSIEDIIATAREMNVPVLVDPKGTNFKKYHGATLLTPNMSEFEAVVGKVKDNADLEQKALKLIEECGLSALLVTRSEDGMSLVIPGKETLHIPTFAREVYDVTGAGDTVIATLAASMASGFGLDRSCAVANCAAGIVVGKLGTSTVSPFELEEEIQSHNGSIIKHAGILNESELLKEVARLKAKGKRIVMTNGCFDIIHKGHVDYLQKARALGDVLIVAVNSDDSVARLKGPTRPIVTCEDRMDVLSALGCVDIVVPFSEDTPQRLIAAVLPDVLVKGGDYKVEQIAGHKEVLANGGRVELITFVDNRSTSNIVKKIKEQ